MRRYAAVMFLLAGACSPGPGGNQVAGGTETMDHLQCAAMISAADKLMNSGAVPADKAFANAALVAAMTHLNAYAIPKGIAEKEAFAAVEAERVQITSSMPPAEIVDAAKRCVADLPH